MNRQQKQAENKKFYAIQRAENKADVYIFGDISEYRDWYGDGSTVNPRSFREEIKDLDVEAIDVHINCYGGSVSAGWAIYSELRQHKAKIRTFAEGFVCSAALYPFLAGDERIANSVSAFYLHEVSTGAWGYAKDLRAAAEEAEKLTEIGINAFIERAGMQRETVETLMERETWLMPEEALSYGIATEVKTEEDENDSQSALKDIVQIVFNRNLPKDVETPRNVKETKEPEQKVPEEHPEQTLMQRLAGIFNA